MPKFYYVKFGLRLDELSLNCACDSQIVVQQRVPFVCDQSSTRERLSRSSITQVRHGYKRTHNWRPHAERFQLVPCVDGSELARAFFTFCSIGRCSHVFGLLMRFT
jgi:hypothetical protein